MAARLGGDDRSLAGRLCRSRAVALLSVGLVPLAGTVRAADRVRSGRRP